MSQENVDVVTGLFPGPDVDVAQLFRSEEMWTALAEFVGPLIDPDFVSIGPDTPGNPVWVGLEGFRAMCLDWLEPWETYRMEIERSIDLGDRVLVLLTVAARTPASSQEVTSRVAFLQTVRGGKLVRQEVYANQAEALKAVGLED